MSIRKEVLPSGRVSWLVRYYDETGRRRSKRCRTRELAKDFAARVRVSVADGTYIDPELAKMSLAEYAVGVVADADIRISTRSLYDGHLRNQIVPRLGHRSIGSIRRGDVRSFLSELRRDGVGASTILHVHRLLRMILGVAVDEERIPTNPAARIKGLPREERREVYALTVGEVDRLAGFEAVRSEMQFKTGLTVSGGMTVAVPEGVFADPVFPTKVQDLIPMVSVDGTDTISYIEQTALTNNAGVVAVSATKPTTDLTLTRRSRTIYTIAHIVPGIPNQYLADEDSLAQVIAGTLFDGVRDALEDEVLNGDGSGNLLGFLDAGSGVSTTAFDVTGILTTIRKAKTALQTRGVNPTAVVLSSSDLESLELLSDGDDRPLFQIEGPVGDAATRVWGMNTFWSTNIASGTALLGDFGRGARLYVREGARIDVDPYTGFASNTTTFRCEGRFALGIVMPEAFQIADLAA